MGADTAIRASLQRDRAEHLAAEAASWSAGSGREPATILAELEAERFAAAGLYEEVTHDLSAGTGDVLAVRDLTGFMCACWERSLLSVADPVPWRARSFNEIVYCGRPRCRGKLARIGVAYDTDGLAEPIRQLGFGRGWKYGIPDGVWSLTRHAAGKSAAGIEPNYRWSTALGHRLGAGSRDFVAVHPRRLPAVVACPECGQRNLLDPVAVGVDLAPGDAGMWGFAAPAAETARES